MEPTEYCSLYITSPQKGQRGYRAACVRALVHGTLGFYSQQTIDKNWGAEFEKRPDAVLQILEIAHTINTMHMTLEQIQPLVTKLLEHADQVAPYKKHK
ncbi:MAG: hypothetical protein KME29_13140 [Calothrix sp. FI2-JRJ7]|jgi:hypothetical protein|nr:hypothetical protein [Calothrix sp. FI2-JRJ7]